ncbi:MAG: outer membrane beta-barrel protein [Candidatus Cryptobacteroides sp.]
MKKKLLVSLFTLLACLGAKAQWSVGVMAGYDYNMYSVAKGYAYDYRYGGMGGLEVTVPVQYNFFDWLGLRADISYVQKGHTMHRTGVYEGEWTNTRDHYLHVPLMLSFSFGGKKVRGWVDAGGYVGGWLASWQKGVATTVIGNEQWQEGSFKYYQDVRGYYFDEKVEFLDKRDKRFDAGLTGLAGVGWKVTPLVELRLEGVCWYSLIDTASGTADNVAPRYNTTWALRLGCAFHFGRVK